MFIRSIEQNELSPDAVQCMQTLESQAGFPVGGGDADVATEQWEEFTTQFRDVLNLLKRIASVWDLEDPCVISGLHIDRWNNHYICFGTALIYCI